MLEALLQNDPGGRLLTADIPSILPVGGEGDFATGLAATQPHITRLVQRLLGWPGRRDVDDVVQETLLRAWARRATYRGEGTLRSWVSAISVRCARNHLRAHRRLLRRREDVDPDGTPGTLAPSHDDQSHTLRTAVQSLPQRHREVLVLRYLEDLTVPDIATLLQCSRNTIDVRLSRARKALEQRLERLDRGDPS